MSRFAAISAGALLSESQNVDSNEMSRKLMDHSVDHELVVVAGDPHGYIGKAEDYFFSKMVKFFDEHVKNRKISPRESPNQRVC
jgi:hypothetical protein